MMTEVFSTTLPMIVTGGFASSYLLLLSVANLGGSYHFAEKFTSTNPCSLLIHIQ